MITHWTNRASTHNPLAGVIAKSQDVAGDFIDLTELQIRLARADGAEFAQKSVLGVVGAILGAVFALASLPLILFGLATLVAEMSSLQLWAAQLVVGTITFLLSALILWMSVFRLRRSLESFETSTKQLANNFSWLKNIVRNK